MDDSGRARRLSVVTQLALMKQSCSHVVHALLPHHGIPEPLVGHSGDKDINNSGDQRCRKITYKYRKTLPRSPQFRQVCKRDHHTLLHLEGMSHQMTMTWQQG